MGLNPSPFPGGSASASGLSRVFVAGHSYVSGLNVTESGGRWVARLCAALAAEEISYGYTQAVLACDTNNGAQFGGYPSVINALTARSFAAGVPSVRNAAPYQPVSDVVVFNYGVNDLAYLTATTATNVAWFQSALTACCCLARSGGWFPDTDASVSYGSGWNANINESGIGWVTTHGRSTAPGTFTITTPADYPGTEIDIFLLAYGGASGGGALWTAAVNGATYTLDGRNSAFGAAQNRANLMVLQVPAQPAGANTITVTVSNPDSTAQMFFTGWSVTAPWPPLTVILNQPVLPTLPFTPGNGPTHSPITLADLNQLNAVYPAVAALFTDGNVRVGDANAAFAAAGGIVAQGSPKSLFLADGIHPNAAGHALIAQSVLKAIQGAPAPVGAARVYPGGLFCRQVGGVQELAALSANWSKLGGGIAWYAKNAAGSTILRLQLVKSIAGVAGETILTLTAGCWPSTTVTLDTTSWSAGGVPSDGKATVTNAGLLQWQTGDPTTRLDIFAEFPADGPGGLF